MVSGSKFINNMKYLLIQLFGIIVIANSIIAIIGHASDMPWLYNWNTNVGIALPAAIMHLFVGLSILLIGEDLKKINK